MENLKKIVEKFALIYCSNSKIWWVRFIEKSPSEVIMVTDDVLQATDYR